MSDAKHCHGCGRSQPLENFHRDARRPDGRVTRCRDCRKAYRKEVYARDPQAAKDYQRAWKHRNPEKVSGYSRRFRHGLEPAQYQALVAAQDGRCAICGRDDGDLRVDHCHVRHVIRGLLCDRCNRAIGLLGDDPERMEAAAQYVRREGVMPHVSKGH